MKKQKPKRRTRREYRPFGFPVTDYHFEYGDKDGGHDNWVPVKDKNIPVDKSQIATSSSMSVLIPKQDKKKRGYY